MKWILLCGVAGLSALVASSALAQSTEPETELEEIVVTAQKRSENLQSTPLAVSAITAATIERRGRSAGLRGC